MHLRHVSIQHVKGLSEVEMDFGSTDLAGWHVILGDNGSGKTTLIRAIALGLVGPAEAMALREDWARWVEDGHDQGSVGLTLSMEKGSDWAAGKGSVPRDGKLYHKLAIRSLRPEGLPATAHIPRRGELTGEGRPDITRFAWGTGAGWFSASFGPSRRFVGGAGDYQKIFYSNPRVARHLSAFSEQVALSESLAWLVDRQRAGDKDLIQRIKAFVNESALFPHDVTLDEVDDQTLRFSDGNGVKIDASELSDGYRSILILALELLRQMEVTYGIERLFTATGDIVQAPGIVLIDEVDAHLHPSWQATVGQWFTQRFPKVQFITATHSALVCRSIGEKGRVFRLRPPGEEGLQLVPITGKDRDKLWYGSLHRALESPGFGLHLGRSPYGRERVQELGELNRKALRQALSPADEDRREHLRVVLSDASIPGRAGD